VAQPKPAIDPLFTHKSFTKEYLDEVRAYGTAWLDYIDALGAFFEGHPDRQQAYPDEWEYYLKWKDWWTKFSPALPSS
jgi:hypothetical protein